MIEGTQTFLNQLSRVESRKLISRCHVIAWTTNLVLKGYTYIGLRQRLLDMLNEGFVLENRKVAADFIPFAEAESVAENKQLDTFAALSYINKSNILLIAERDNDTQRSETFEQTHVYPYREKKPVGFRVFIPPYTLTGTTYTDNWQQLIHALDDERKFLPVTGAVISQSITGNEWEFDFIALNKSRISLASQI